MNETVMANSGSLDETREAADRLWRLWQEGQRPDVRAFVATLSPLSPERLAEVLRIDQRERWQHGERVPAEYYLKNFAVLLDDPNLVVDMIFNEFLIREKRGEQPTMAEYLRRFPEQALVLKSQMELHEALAADSRSEAAEARPPQSATVVSAGQPYGAEADSLKPYPSETPNELTFAAPLELPEQFGRYRIIKLLGRGGMGMVYLAHDELLDRSIALKVPHFARSQDPMILERLYREARIACTLTDPHLCPIYEVGAIDGLHYLTMPLISGESLAAWLKRAGPLPVDDAIQFTCQIARALAVAHRAGVIHRDLKPANVMVTEGREPVVMDFGLARRTTSRDPRVTASGVILGTPAYSPPEQIGADPAALGPACDVYSLGVILYEMLTGRLPFEGSIQDVLAQVLTQQPEPPSRYRPNLDPRLDAICMTALAKDPNARFESMEEFATVVERCLQQDSVKPTLVSPAVSRIFSFQRKRWADRGRSLPRSRAAWLTVLGLLLLSPAGIFWAIRSPATNEGEILELRPGSDWSGKFYFNQFDYAGDVRVRITRRDGYEFEGTYTTEEGAYQWLIKGTTYKNIIRWEFTEAVRDNKEKDVVGRAFVEGMWKGNKIEAEFHQPALKESAHLTLQLQP